MLFNPIVKNFKIDNFKIDLDIRESLERKLFFEKKYEEDRLSYLIKKINEDKISIFLDVGANIGIYSLRVAANTTSIKKIIAFEPLKQTFLKLKKNINDNNLENKIDIYNFGLSVEEKILRGLLRNKCKLRNSGGFTVSNNGNTELITKKFDSLISYNRQNICIKCDVEGHEYEVLQGMEKLITSNLCLLQIEIWDHNFVELTKYLSDCGYDFVKKISGDYYFQNY